MISNPDNGENRDLVIGGLSIKLPGYFPTSTEIDYIDKSNYLNDLGSVDVATSTKWINEYDILNLKRDKTELVDNLTRRIEQMKVNGAKRKIIHYEFATSVKTLDGDSLKLLLTAQNDAGADVIEIPNVFNSNWNYDDVLTKSKDWKTNNNITKQLMGIARNKGDVNLLKSRLNIIDGVGVNLRQKSTTTLLAVEEYLKPLNVWVHGYSAKRSFSKSGIFGTLGILINSFGIDSISTYVSSPESAGATIGAQKKMPQDERLQKAMSQVYFKSSDYSMPMYEVLKTQEGTGNSHKLSKYCNCPICKNNTIETLTRNYDSTFTKTRAHEVFSHRKESGILQTKIHNNEVEEYIKEKTYARQIIDLINNSK